MADFLLALSDFDRARSWGDLGHANLWAFLHRELGLSAGAAHWRKVAAGLVRAFPAVEAALRDGRLCLSTIVELARVLTPDNEASVLPRFFQLSAREAREVSAELAPRPATPTREVITAARAAPSPVLGFRTSETKATRPEQGPGVGTSCLGPSSREGGRGLEPAGLAGAPERGAWTPDGGDASQPMGQVAAPGRPAMVDAPVALAPAGGLAWRAPQEEVTPLSADFRRLHLPVSRGFIEKLEAAKALRSHAQPGAAASAILEVALDLLLAREAGRRQGAVRRPAKSSRPVAPGRISAEVRRQVWARDQGCCQWPLEAGGVCGSTHRLEVDHVRPRARGGGSTADNLRLLCGPHNAEAARRAFGVAFMARVVEQAAHERSGRTSGK